MKGPGKDDPAGAGRQQPGASAPQERNEAPIERLLRIMARLRGPGGCPWDKEQTHLSLRPYLVEETYEALEAIEADDTARMVEELGDVLLQVVFHSQIGAESGRFTFDDVAQAVADKMVRRHPHVFGDAVAADSAAVLRHWERIKQEEARSSPPHSDGSSSALPAEQEAPPSLLDDVPVQLPALVRAEKIQARAARVGFQWPDVEGAIEKVREEAEEVARAREANDQARLHEEWGDLLFALVNVARYLGIDSETALRDATNKFRDRFQYVERQAHASGRSLDDMTLAEMDALWDEAKQKPSRP